MAFKCTQSGTKRCLFLGSNEESLNAAIWTTSLPRIPEDFASYEGLEVSDKAVAATLPFPFAFLLWPDIDDCNLPVGDLDHDSMDNSGQPSRAPRVFS